MKTIHIIPSKSDAHRAYIAAALSTLKMPESKNLNKEEILNRAFSRVICKETSEDIEATKKCLFAMLDSKSKNEDDVIDLYCGESGSTLRFLIPVVGASGINGIFHPKGRLVDRPLSPLTEELSAHGMDISIIRRDEQEALSESRIIVKGLLRSGTYNIPGNISSQFVSGLLFALPVIEGDSRVIINGSLESAPYVHMTLNTLEKFGVKIETIYDEKHIIKELKIEGNQEYILPDRYIVEGDWSNAAFWLVMGAIGLEPIRVKGLNLNSLQGDKAIVDVMKEFGINIKVGSSTEGPPYVEAYPSREHMKEISWDASETPDMVPAIALLGSLAEGVTEIRNAGRLRIKESDRLHTVAVNLDAMGVTVDELDDGLIVHGVKRLRSATLGSHHDHRLAMMAAAASVSMLGSGEKIRLAGYSAVNKSYPTFFEVLHDVELDSNIEKAR